jgi:hypothetical protein
MLELYAVRILDRTSEERSDIASDNQPVTHITIIGVDSLIAGAGLIRFDWPIWVGS